MQIRSLFSAKSFEGTVVAARALGFLEAGTEEVTSDGRRFALATAEDKTVLLRSAMEEYEPYGLLLEAILGHQPPTSTKVEWIARWWAAHGYGSSESNREEAATTFARLCDFVGFGTYVQGRRGHPTRIEWRRGGAPVSSPPSAAAPVIAHLSEPPRGWTEPVEDSPSPPKNERTQRDAPSPPAPASGPPEGYSTVTVALGPGRTAGLTVPSTLSRGEKHRLLSLLDLLITETPEAE